MKQTKWHFELHDGKGGIIIFGEPVSMDQVQEECVQRFGAHRLKEVTVG